MCGVLYMFLYDEKTWIIFPCGCLIFHTRFIGSFKIFYNITFILLGYKSLKHTWDRVSWVSFTQLLQ